MQSLLLLILRPFASLLFKTLQRYQALHRSLPEWYFFALERTVPIPAFELLICKNTSEGKKLFLIKRPHNDPTWPLQWHWPGTIERYHDSLEEIEKRWAKELDIPLLPKKPSLLTVCTDEDRGRHAHIFYTLHVTPDTEYTTGSFFLLSDLPMDMIAFQKRQLDNFKGLLDDEANF